MLSRRTIRGPATGFFHTAVRTVRPCQVTSLGKPTFTDSKLPARRSMITSSAPDHRDPLTTSLEGPISPDQPGALGPGIASRWCARALTPDREPVIDVE